jgi:hypothetical protein
MPQGTDERHDVNLLGGPPVALVDRRTSLGPGHTNDRFVSYWGIYSMSP